VGGGCIFRRVFALPTKRYTTTERGCAGCGILYTSVPFPWLERLSPYSLFLRVEQLTLGISQFASSIESWVGMNMVAF